MEKARVWAEKVTIPTYEIGAAEKNPMFLDKRVYQGSSGRVYPYPTVESISDTKRDKEYTAVFLENEYLKVMVLPELGGRIQRALDKTNNYDFVYYNHVIKPALVGLTGPWISGGIEFNWPQHHRPTTFLPVEFTVVNGEDGSAAVLLHDTDRMYGTSALTKIALYPGRAYIEITGKLYNGTGLPQTFLWWANPAVAVNDDTQSVFPPDVHAVMDHGKRDVSRFPIATGVYYKKDYSEGVDISRYKNIPVPTSYMAERSKYDFVGGYDYGVGAGILHVADHHISPGKKQWTWGCGDFGRAWDRNLTDSDGPYVELMTGVYTDNQPDFTWLKPFEEKVFRQYFMPYKALGQVKNATVDAAVNLEVENGVARLAVYATGAFAEAEIVLKAGNETVFSEKTGLSPTEIFEKTVRTGDVAEEDLSVAVYGGGRRLVEYRPERRGIPKMPEPAKPAREPEEYRTNEELYLTGQHIEQYRHATYLPDPYYLEGLKRDPGDIRINNAYGQLLTRRGQFKKAEPYLRRALERLTERNPNPYNSETYYLLGLDLFYQDRPDEAYDAFYKATWTSEQQEMSFYYLAAIDARAGRYDTALEHIDRSLVKNSHNIKARGLRAYLLRKLGDAGVAGRWIEENLELEPFDFVSLNEKVLLGLDDGAELDGKTRGFRENYLGAARAYAEMGGYDEASDLLARCGDDYPMLRYYRAYYEDKLGKQDEAKKLLELAEASPTDYCFPNNLEDIPVLEFAIGNGCLGRAPYYLGCLRYDKLDREEALRLWEMSARERPCFPTVWRNLGLVYYNQLHDGGRAQAAMERAFALDETDARVFLELDRLYKMLGRSCDERLRAFEDHRELAESRDDLYTEYVTLVNESGEYERALELITRRHFHPWEGGEGKIAAQYTLALLELARGALREKRYGDAEGLLRRALVYPESLGEGKLEGTKDNHIYYHLGLALEGQGRAEEARECYMTAAVGTDEPAGAMYYNDQPADMILYQGLALLKLGDVRAARSRFYRLIDYGERHLEDNVKIDYFAVSLPDLLIFDEDYTAKNRAHCDYLMGLGHLGLGDRPKAADFFQRALEIEPSHQLAAVYLRLTGGLTA